MVRRPCAQSMAKLESPALRRKRGKAPSPLGEATSKGPQICIGYHEIRSGEMKQDFLD